MAQLGSNESGSLDPDLTAGNMPYRFMLKDLILAIENRSNGSGSRVSPMRRTVAGDAGDGGVAAQTGTFPLLRCCYGP